MCGISALIGKNGGHFESAIKSMTNAISHRGPDGEGVFIESHLALGHRRLSIVDLTTSGSQPLFYQDRYVIVYNGEIYNHIELRAELEAKGYKFTSYTDTEVILAAYAEWGKACLDHFNGMWSFVLFDKQKKVVFCARDRFGVKPFYYWISSSGVLAIASEIKQFTVLSDWAAKLNGARAFEFLNWGVLDHTQETLFKDVYQLRGGESVEFSLLNDLDNLSLGSFQRKIEKWYTPKRREISKNFRDQALSFKNLLEDAVRLRLRADVPVGSCLSGGLDSTSIVCLMSGILDKAQVAGKQKTFSACAEHKKYDERGYIDQVVSKTEVEAHYTYPNVVELFSEVEKITWHQDEPFGSTSIFAQWKVFQKANECRIKVMLDGQGADEILAGYHSFFGKHWAKLLFAFRWNKLRIELKAARSVHGYSWARIARTLALSLLPKFMIGMLKNLRLSFVKSEIWFDKNKFGVGSAGKLLPQSKGFGISAVSKSQLFNTSVPMLLHWEDRDSMAHGIESRVPFLDYRLVETSLSLPDDCKLKQGVTKVVLREAMSGILPESVRMRMDKMGFVTPEEVWMKGDSSSQFKMKIEEAVYLSKGLINSNIVKMYDEMVAGERPFDFLYWRVISFGVWLKVFKVEV